MVICFWYLQEEIVNIQFDMFFNKDVVKMGVKGEGGIGLYLGV